MLLGIKRMRDKEKWTDYLVSPFFVVPLATNATPHSDPRSENVALR